ncbi:MAG: hypothetical protein K8E24_015660, partial [Methanobacterium paludis]|nr:hypothetical protein [Methanobacterium paludis]
MEVVVPDSYNNQFDTCDIRDPNIEKDDNHMNHDINNINETFKEFFRCRLFNEDFIVFFLLTT